ncbi:hypothetical protein AAKU58_000544 [Oxalobacteraceae bacterium GrIS 1.18]
MISLVTSSENIMQISLKNSYFSQKIDVNAALQKFREAAPEDRNIKIQEMIGWFDPVYEWFGGYNKQKALSYLFEMAQADVANKKPDITDEERVANRDKAIAAFKGLESCTNSLSSKFEITNDANGKLIFKVHNTYPIAETAPAPVEFSVFDTQQAKQDWNSIKSSFTHNRPQAAALFNKMAGSSNSIEKIDCFTQLADLACPDDQGKFKISISGGVVAYRASVKLGIGDVVLAKDLGCQKSQIEEITKSLLNFPGAVQAADLGSDECMVTDKTTPKMLLIAAGFLGNLFNQNDEIKSTAAKILTKMCDPSRTLDEDIASCVELSKLDNRFVFSTSVGTSAECVMIGGIHFADRPKPPPRFGPKLPPEMRAIEKFKALPKLTKATKSKEAPEAMTTALKDESGKIIAYRDPLKKGYQWVALPPEKRTRNEGTYKKLTHVGTDYVGLTFHRPYRLKGKLFDPSAPHPRTFTFAASHSQILTCIKDNNLDCIIPQIRINKTQFLSRNMGAQDMYDLAISEDHNFDHRQWREVLQNLDVLHGNGIVHRDIKCENMVLYKNKVRLVDLDSMGYVGSFGDKDCVGTPAYLHPILRYSSYNKVFSGVPYEKIIDQYAMLNSMISVFYDGYLPKNGVFNLNKINEFLRCLPCKDELKKELRSFLFYPLRCPLPAHRRLEQFVLP